MAWTVRSWRGTNDEHGDERRQRTVSNGHERGDWQSAGEGRREENEDPIKRRVLLRWLSSGQHLRATAALVRSIVRQRLKDKSNRACVDRDAKSLEREEIGSSLLARCGRSTTPGSWRSRRLDKVERFVSCAIRYQTN